MRRNMLVLLAISALISPGLNAQGRRGGAAGGPAQMQSRQAAGRGQQGTLQRDMQRDMQRDRLRTQATDQQRQQFETCDQSMDRVRTQARDMARSKDRAFNVDAARQQRDQLRDRVANMQQEHERLMQGLGTEQQSAVQARVRAMQQIQERMNTRLQRMDQELAKAQPSGKAFRAEARLMQREMNNWENQYRGMGADLGLDE